MIQRQRLSPALAATAVLLALAALAGCGGKSKQKVIEPPVITHRDADDIVQAIATTVSADNGGWYYTIKVMAESVAVAPADFPTGPGDSVSFARSQAGLTYHFTMRYFHPDQSSYATRDTGSDHLEATISADDGVFTNVNGVTGVYGYHSDRDLFVVYNLHAVYDTLEFSNLAEDSVYAVVHSSIDSGSVRAWYHDNALDFEPNLKLLKTTLTTNPYPVAGEVDWFVIDAQALKSASQADVDYDDFAEGIMTFNPNGGPVATFSLVDIGSEGTHYDYSLNLNTGEVHRLN